uniref:glutathione S-transferase T3-like n=1 Tax=Erigeron canadensis TaxID=72917 RepID=UPI001CB92010|nr:glutathione S-transferase T3-like [Erigeron canadensis]
MKLHDVVDIKDSTDEKDEVDGDMFLDEVKLVDIHKMKRRWDVISVKNKYMSTDFIISDAKGNVLHCFVKASIAYRFKPLLEEGCLYMMNDFTVLPNPQKYRIMKDVEFMIEIDGSTLVTKQSDDVDKFIRHPFQLVSFEQIVPTNSKYFVDLRTDDVIPETQPVEEQDEVKEVDCRGKKKVFVGRKRRKHWTEDQKVALAQAWIQISECKKYGIEQKAEGFWKRVLQHYTSTLGSTTRTFHSLTTKWKAMNMEMGVFNGLWIQAFRAKGSGCNDLDVTTTALSDYHTKLDKHFTHLPAWHVVKTRDKWKQQDCFADIVGMGIGSSSGSSKRKSADYESASNDNVLPDMNEDPSPPLEPRKMKKKQSASSCSSVSNVAEEITKYTQQRTSYLDKKEEKEELAKRLMATQLEGEMFKNRHREFDVFMKPHDHITDPALLECVLEEKCALGKKKRMTL